MKTALAIAGAVLLLDVTPAIAHRLDEYLEATLISVSRQRVRLDVRLAPGVLVVPTVLDSIDLNRDGALSDSEEAVYATRVMNDLRLAVDDNRVELHLISRRFPGIPELKDGTGEIRLALEGVLAAGGDHRRLTFENHHRAAIAAYLVNGLVPDDPGISITSQDRNYTQSLYALNYEQGSPGTASVPFATLLRWVLVFGALAIAIANGVGAAVRRLGSARAAPHT